MVLLIDDTALLVLGFLNILGFCLWAQHDALDDVVDGWLDRLLSTDRNAVAKEIVDARREAWWAAMGPLVRTFGVLMVVIHYGALFTLTLMHDPARGVQVVALAIATVVTVWLTLRLEPRSLLSRRDFADHLFRLSTLHCTTPTARSLILAAQCSAVS